MLRRLRSPGAGVVVLVLLLAEELTQKQYTVLRSHKSVLQRHRIQEHSGFQHSDSHDLFFVIRRCVVRKKKKLGGSDNCEIGYTERGREKKKIALSLTHSKI